MIRLPHCLTLAAIFVVSQVAHAAEWEYLFKGKTLDDFYVDFIEKTEAAEVFEIDSEGTLHIRGKDKPIGFIQTLDPYENYEIEFEFRWPDKPGNSGLQLHCSDARYHSIWPQCIEVQLEHGNVGDFWLLGESITVEESQFPEKTSERDRRLKLLDAEEKKTERWNSVRVIAKADTITVYLNKKLVNKGTEASAKSGYITIRSEASNLVIRGFRLRKL